MTVARRFIAGSGTTWGLRSAGTPESPRAINPKDIVLQSRYRVFYRKLILEASRQDAAEDYS
jgi:hypothetical protein